MTVLQSGRWLCVLGVAPQSWIYGDNCELSFGRCNKLLSGVLLLKTYKTLVRSGPGERMTERAKQ